MKNRNLKDESLKIKVDFLECEVILCLNSNLAPFLIWIFLNSRKPLKICFKILQFQLIFAASCAKFSSYKLQFNAFPTNFSPFPLNLIPKSCDKLNMNVPIFSKSLSRFRAFNNTNKSHSFSFNNLNIFTTQNHSIWITANSRILSNKRFDQHDYVTINFMLQRSWKASFFERLENST